MDVHKKDWERTIEMDDPFEEFGPNFEVLDSASIADAVEYDQQLRSSMRKKKFSLFSKKKRKSYLDQGIGTFQFMNCVLLFHLKMHPVMYKDKMYIY